MPHFPVPSPVVIQQWRIRYSSGIKARMAYPAIFQHRITWPENIKAMGFVQLISGPVLPMFLNKKGPTPGEKIMVTLQYDKSFECLRAVHKKTEIQSTNTSFRREEFKPVEKTNRIVPLPRPKPVDVQKLLPANAVVIAEFMKYAPKGESAWITVAIPISETQKRNWSFPIYKEVVMAKFKGITSGTRCRIRIKKWITKKGQLTPLLAFIGWVS